MTLATSTTVRRATLADLPYVDALCGRFSREVGFIPRIAIENRISGNRGGYVGVAIENDDPAGFLHTGSLARPECRIFQAAIQYDAQRQRHGRLLVNDFIDVARAAGVKLVTLRCLSDLDANAFWRAAGFRRVGIEPVSGRKNRGALLNVWARRLHTIDELLAPGFRLPAIPMRRLTCRGCGRPCSTFARGPQGQLFKQCPRCVAAGDTDQ